MTDQEILRIWYYNTGYNFIFSRSKLAFFTDKHGFRNLFSRITLVKEDN